MQFQIGDAVVHPVRGAGVIAGLKRFEALGDKEEYYQIDLLRRTNTNLMIPVKDAESQGLRPAVPSNKLERVWRIFYKEPEQLPSNHRARYKVINERLQAGDIYQLTAAVRDMAWRRRENDGFTTKGKRLYEKGVRLLAGEIAVSQGIGLADAEEQIQEQLRAALPPEEAEN
jgi:RNA polymerase-interacting CarD/CdnL/TRCF family regulator